MPEPLLGPDRVTLLLSLVPYLREHGPTRVDELAADFEVDAEQLRSLVRFLGTAGVPGETMSYQHEDLFDIDWDALERDDVVSLTRTVAVDAAPRFAPTETAALVAGLQALTAILPAHDAAVARRLADKLGAAFRSGSGAAGSAGPVSITPDAADPALGAIVQAIDHRRALAFSYRDIAGRPSEREVEPIELQQEGESWTLRGFCRERRAERTFRVAQMRGIREIDQIGERTGTDAPSVAAAFDLVASVPTRLLHHLGGFVPELVEETGDGRVRVRVDAWHAGAAVRLAQSAPGEVEIETPAEARVAVREWAERALGGYRDTSERMTRGLPGID